MWLDPSWVEIHLGSVKPFDTVVLYWENAYATQYQIQYSTDNTNWSVADNNMPGVGGVETLSFPTVKGRYVRMYGEQRATQYGYSMFEFQVYDVAQCGAASERYTILNSSTGQQWDDDGDCGAAKRLLDKLGGHVHLLRIACRCDL